MNEVLHEAIDAEAGIKASVFRNAKGFAVVTRDMDAEATYSIVIFPTLDQAKANAETLVK